MKYGEATFCCTVQMNHDDFERYREFCEQLNRSQQTVLLPTSATVELVGSNLPSAEVAESARRDLRNWERNQ